MKLVEVTEDYLVIDFKNKIFKGKCKKKDFQKQMTQFGAR